ncbi:MAG: HIT family protein [Methanobacteriota archaeon]|nr:MAG: HIT family protein [Euryarchaeota archaeon]
MTDCIFCKIVDGSIPSFKVWENDRFMMFLDIRPINRGHSLVIPKFHVDYLFDMETNDYQELMSIVKQVSEPLRKSVGAKRIGIAVEGFEVPHAHVHLIPIDKAGQLNPANAKQVPTEELSEIAEKIRNGFSQN